MIIYHPLTTGVTWDSNGANLRRYDWEAGTAEFLYPEEDGRSVFVHCRQAIAVRMLDEFDLSIASDPAHRKGLVPHHFAYRVEGDPFFALHAPHILFSPEKFAHYRFITGNGCLDAISDLPPEFAIR